MRPVVEDLVIVPLQLFPAGLHLDEDALWPQEIDVVFPFCAALFRDSDFAGCTGLLDAVMAEGAEKLVEEIGAFALFIAG